MEVLVLIETALLTVFAVELALVLRRRPEKKPQDELSKRDVDTIKQIVNVMNYMGDFGHEDQDKAE